jgi:hypothetical protein
LYAGKREKEQRMTLTIEVSGELEAALQAQAYEQGLTAGGVARRVLEQALTPGMEREEAGLSTAGTTGKERARAFAEWARSHRDTPPLSDEAISRTNMYPDRW